MQFGVALSRKSASMAGAAFKKPGLMSARQFNMRPRFYSSGDNAPLAKSFTINGDRLW